MPEKSGTGSPNAGPIDQYSSLQDNYVLFYEAYGLGVHSEFPLPELIAKEAITANITIRVGISTCGVSEDRSVRTHDSKSREVIHHRPGVGSCLVRDGREIIVEPCSGADPIRVRHFVLQHGLGIAMHQNGRLVLHASAVSAGPHALLFMAPSCGGKSTTAAALHSWGYGVIADDVVVLDVAADDTPVVYPASPLLKVCPDAAAHLGYDRQNLRPVAREDDRLSYIDNRSFRNDPTPVAVIYLLAEGAFEKIEPLSSQEAFLELLRFTLPAVTEIIEASETSVDHFLRCAITSQRIPVRRLTRRMELNSLNDVLKVIQGDLISLGKNAVRGLIG